MLLLLLMGHAGVHIEVVMLLLLLMGHIGVQIEVVVLLLLLLGHVRVDDFVIVLFMLWGEVRVDDHEVVLHLLGEIYGAEGTVLSGCWVGMRRRFVALGVFGGKKGEERRVGANRPADIICDVRRILGDTISLVSAVHKSQNRPCGHPIRARFSPFAVSHTLYLAPIFTERTEVSCIV